MPMKREAQQSDESNPLGGLSDDGFTRPLRAFEMVGIAPSTGWLWIKQGLFPRPVQLGPNTSGIPNRALKRWAAARCAEAA